MIARLFTDHPESVGETYGEHFAQASGFGFSLISAGMCCLLHGVFPFIFKHNGSDTVKSLHARLSNRRAHPGAPAALGVYQSDLSI